MCSTCHTHPPTTMPYATLIFCAHACGFLTGWVLCMAKHADISPVSCLPPILFSSPASSLTPTTCLFPCRYCWRVALASVAACLCLLCCLSISRAPWDLLFPAWEHSLLYMHLCRVWHPASAPPAHGRHGSQHFSM